MSEKSVRIGEESSFSLSDNLDFCSRIDFNSTIDENSFVIARLFKLDFLYLQHNRVGELAFNRVGWLPFLICFPSVHKWAKFVVLHLLLDMPEDVDVFLYTKTQDFHHTCSKIAIEGMRFNEISIC